MDDLPSSCKSVKILDEKFQIFIQGTAHVSSESYENVERVINVVKPGLVVVELCMARSNMLNPEALEQEEEEETTLGNIELMKLLYKRYKETKSITVVMYIMIAAFVANVAKELNVKAGAEFTAAGRACAHLRIPIIFGDRPVSLTLRRLWEALSVIERLKMAWILLWSKPTTEELSELNEALKDESSDNFVEKGLLELSEKFPQVKRVMVDERDMFMAHTILGRCRRMMNILLLTEGEVFRIVVVTGKGHVEGLMRYLEHEEELVDFGELVDVGSDDSYLFVMKVLRWTIRLIILLFTCLFIYFLYRLYGYFGF